MRGTLRDFLRLVLLPVTLACLCVPETARAGLDILLTNDDGIDARGLRTLREALLTAGHEVRVIAPAGNRSGSGASLTIGPIDVTKHELGLAVTATPASTIMVAVGMQPRPVVDLVVSGTNHGANVGYVTPVSGTVGAALIAASGLGLGVPAIAVSTDLPGRDPASDASAVQLRRAARVAVRLIAALEAATKGKGPLLPPGVVLNANVPLTERHLGVRICRQGDSGTIGITYQEKQPGRFVPQIRHAPEGQTHTPGSDTAAFRSGYTTIVPLRADYTAEGEILGAMRERLSSALSEP